MQVLEEALGLSLLATYKVSKDDTIVPSQKIYFPRILSFAQVHQKASVHRERNCPGESNDT